MNIMRWWPWRSTLQHMYIVTLLQCQVIICTQWLRITTVPDLSQNVCNINNFIFSRYGEIKITPNIWVCCCRKRNKIEHLLPTSVCCWPLTLQCNVSMSILCRGEPVTWKFVISNEHCCTHFVWWWSIITTVQSTIRTIGYSKQRKYFLMQFKKNLRGQTMLHHHAVNNNTFSTFLGQKCFEFLFSGPAQQYLSSIMILDNGFGQNVTYLSKSPRNPTVSSKLVSVVGSHAMRDIECRKKHFAVWICWNKPWTCRVRAWQQDNYQEQDQMQLLLWYLHFYCICNEGCEADHWKVPISKIPQLTLSTHRDTVHTSDLQLKLMLELGIHMTSFEIYLSFLILPLGCGEEAMYKDKGWAIYLDIWM